MRRARQTELRGQLEWQANRTTGKVMRRELTDAIQQFVQYAESLGSKNATRYYGNYDRKHPDIMLQPGEHINSTVRRYCFDHRYLYRKPYKIWRIR